MLDSADSREPGDVSRDRTIWNRIAKSATEILSHTDCETAFPVVLQLIGSSIGARRVRLVEFQRSADGTLTHLERCNWAIDARSEPANAPPPAIETIPQGENFEPNLQRIVDAEGNVSALIAPIFVLGEWWGQAVFEDCEAGAEWSAIARDAIETLAEFIGACIFSAERNKHLADAHRVIENSPAIVFRFAPTPEPKLVYVSGNVERLGYSAGQLMASPEFWLSCIYPGDRAAMRSGMEDVVLGRRQDHSLGFRWRKPDGSLAWIDGRIWGVRDPSGQLVALEGAGVDISDRKAVETKLSALVKTDDLTWLLNRKGFVERLDVVNAKMKRKGAAFAVHVLNLDNFKDVNDTLGHPVGDRLLRAVAKRLARTLSPDDVVARISADFFAILQMGISDPADAEALAERLLQSIKETIKVGSNRISITASVGIAPFDGCLSNATEMLAHADLALHEAKRAGGDRSVVYSREMNRSFRLRMSMTDDLRAALESGEQLRLYYQPQVEIASGRITGMEALLRWEHPLKGLLLPGQFIAIAERSAMIGPLGDWVLNEACRQMSEWTQERICPPILGVNLSPAQFKLNPNLDRTIAETLGKWSLDPRQLEFEITETVLMDRTGERRGQLNKLKELGVRVAIDDFGTGYSSLDFLLAFKINRLKIAQQFVEGLPGKPDHAAVTRATLGLAREFGIEVIAEGTETSEQLDFLVSAGCLFAQGFYFSRPVTAAVATELLHRGCVDAWRRE
jgi:diguanylate cyclase (GGDEF)-like protein/PAS domain S-box-containing protein